MNTTLIDKLFEWGIFICLFIIFTLMSALILWPCWNWLAPIFWTTAPSLTFIQTWGIIIFIVVLRNVFRLNINFKYNNSNQLNY